MMNWKIWINEIWCQNFQQFWVFLKNVFHRQKAEKYEGLCLYRQFIAKSTKEFADIGRLMTVNSRTQSTIMNKFWNAECCLWYSSRSSWSWKYRNQILNYFLKLFKRIYYTWYMREISIVLNWENSEWYLLIE